MITVELFQVSDFARKLDSVAAKLPSVIATTAKAAGEHLQIEVQDTIHSQREGWPGLSPTYATWKAKHGFDGRTLIRSGILLHTIYSAPIVAAANAVSGLVSVRPGPSYPPMATLRRLRKKPVDRAKAGKLTKVSAGGKSRHVLYIATLHEDGRAPNKKRPYFAPTHKREEPKIIALFKNAFFRMWNL